MRFFQVCIRVLLLLPFIFIAEYIVYSYLMIRPDLFRYIIFDLTYLTFVGSLFIIPRVIINNKKHQLFIQAIMILLFAPLAYWLMLYIKYHHSDLILSIRWSLLRSVGLLMFCCCVTLTNYSIRIISGIYLFLLAIVSQFIANWAMLAFTMSRFSMGIALSSTIPFAGLIIGLLLGILLEKGDKQFYDQADGNAA